MYPTVYQPHDFIIKEGEVGHEVYVMEGMCLHCHSTKMLLSLRPLSLLKFLRKLKCYRSQAVNVFPHLFFDPIC